MLFCALTEVQQKPDFEVKMQRISGRFNYPKVQGTTFSKPSKALQHFKDDCDINKLFKKYKKDKNVPLFMNASQPRFGDFTSAEDFHALQNRIAGVMSDFEQLPASVRARFNNDPGVMLDFVADPKNREEAVKLGLLPPPPAPEQNAPKDERPEAQKTDNAPAPQAGA